MQRLAMSEWLWYSHLSVRRHNAALIIEWSLVTLAVIAITVLLIQLNRYSAMRARLPLGLTLGGVDVGGLTPEQAVERVAIAFAAPVDLTYEGEHIPLNPAEVSFRLDREATLAAAEMARDATDFWAGFWDYVRGKPAAVAGLELQSTYSREQLVAVLQRIAQTQDRVAQPPQLEAGTLRFLPGEPGRQLDIQASLPRVEAALRSASNRRAELVVRYDSASQATLQTLGALLQGRLSGFDGVVGLYVLDLDTGREMELNGGVAFSGMGLLRLPIVVEAYRKLGAPPDATTRRLISDTLTADDTAAADALLALIGDGEASIGAERVTSLMKTLGLVNTFTVLPYGATPGGQPPTVVTPANSHPIVKTDADPLRQTTPEDMGQLLGMIYQCAHGGGALLAAFPDRLTLSECRQILDALSTVRSGNLIETGIPAQVRLAHRPAWANDTHADAGLVFSPGGDYVFVVFVWRHEYLPWEVSSPLVTELTQATYDFFNRP